MDLWLGGGRDMVMGMSLAEVRPSAHSLTNHPVPNKSFPHMVYTVISQKLLSIREVRPSN